MKKGERGEWLRRIRIKQREKEERDRRERKWSSSVEEGTGEEGKDQANMKGEERNDGVRKWQKDWRGEE